MSAVWASESCPHKPNVMQVLVQDPIAECFIADEKPCRSLAIYIAKPAWKAEIRRGSICKSSQRLPSA